MAANRGLAPLTFSMFGNERDFVSRRLGSVRDLKRQLAPLTKHHETSLRAGEKSVQNKTHRKSIRSIRFGIEFPICLHPTRSSAGEDGRARSLHIDDIAIFDRNPHFDVPSNMHLQCRRRIGRARTPKQETAAWAAIPGPVRCACRTAFDRARNTIRVRMTGTGRSFVRL